LHPPRGTKAAPKLTTRLDRLIRRHQGDIVIDLSEAGFIASSFAEYQVRRSARSG